MKSVLLPLVKSCLMPFGLKTTASATDPALQKKIYESGMTTLIILNEEIKDIVEIVKHLEE